MRTHMRALGRERKQITFMIWSLFFRDIPITIYYHPEVSDKKGVALKPKAALVALRHHATTLRATRAALGF